MPTYATDIFDGNGSTDEFDLTFSFISRDHVGVKSINKASGAETALTVITTGVPTGNEYRWENDTRIKVGTAPLSTQQIKIERDTPEDQQLVPWTDGSYLLSEDLNTSDLQWLYGLQELEDQITELNGSGAGAAVKGVTGVSPVQVNQADQQNPVVSVDQLDSTANPNTALTSDTDLLSAKAVDAFYSQIVGSGAGYPAGSVGKDGKLRIDPSGPTPNLYYWNQASTSWVQLPTKGDTGSPGPDGPAPGLQSPAADANNVQLKGDGTLGDATATVAQDANGDLKFSFGVPVGATGATGATGETGSGGTVDAGSATSLAYDAAPTVNNSGSTTAAVFNFGIPKGMPQKVGIAGVPPTSIAGSPVKPGDLWLDDNTLQLYVYYKDPSGDEYWVSVSRMGEQGPAATVAVGVTTTGSPGTNASVVNNGTSGAAVLNFTIPRGEKGDQGDRGNDGSNSTVPGPVGPGATVDVGTTTTLGPGNNAYVNNTGTTTNAYLQFGIPKGDTGSTGKEGSKGDAGTIVVDQTITLASDRAANVVNIGTNTEAELVFYIPQGIPGDPQDVHLSDARPTTINGSPVRAGALWFNTSNAQLYTYYVDPSGDKYWVSTTRTAPSVAQVGASPPVSPANGQFFYDTASSKLKVYVNGSWTDV